jgi:hypothetical protein
VDEDPEKITQRRTLQFRSAAGFSLAAGVCALVIGACAPGAEVPMPGSTSKQPPEADLPAAAVTGEVPRDLLDAIIDDLARQESLSREEIEVERAQSVIWPDGSLGCPTPGEMYTHAVVPGYWVVLRHADKYYDYRASLSGSFRHCSDRFKRQLPAG